MKDVSELKLLSQTAIKDRHNAAKRNVPIAYQRIWNYAQHAASKGATVFTVKVLDPFLYHPLEKYLREHGFVVENNGTANEMRISFTPDGSPGFTLRSLEDM
jgi:hypothetical protein